MHVQKDCRVEDSSLNHREWVWPRYLHPNIVELAGGGVKDVPFFPYAPYLPQTEMSVTGASFSQKRVQLPSVAEENGQEEVEERVDDNERVHSSVLAMN